jgi:hypothetical protein
LFYKNVTPSGFLMSLHEASDFEAAQPTAHVSLSLISTL